MSWYCSEVYRNISSNIEGYWKPCCIAKKVNRAHITDTKFLDFFNSDEMNQLKEDQKNGVMSELVNKTCFKCISDEKKGVVSRRMKSNKLPPELSGRIESIKIKHIGNMCDQLCVMCNPDYSFSIAAESAQHFGYTGPVTRRFEPTSIYLEGLKEVLDNVRIIKIVGGEPLINPMTYDFLEWLDENNFNHLQVKMTTNCSSFPKKEILNKFRKIIMNCSIDAYGARCEYIRHPMKFDRAIRHIERYIEAGWKVKLTSAVSIVNFGYMNELKDFIGERLGLNINIHSINLPATLAPENIPTEIKKQYDVPDPLKSLINVEPNEELFQEGINYLKSLDKIRDNNLLDHCPEFKKYYELS